MLLREAGSASLSRQEYPETADIEYGQSQGRPFLYLNCHVLNTLRPLSFYFISNSYKRKVMIRPSP